MAKTQMATGHVNYNKFYSLTYFEKPMPWETLHCSTKDYNFHILKKYFKPFKHFRFQKESLNSDGQQFHQYQQNKQSLLTLLPYLNFHFHFFIIESFALAKRSYYCLKFRTHMSVKPMTNECVDFALGHDY